MCQKCLDAVAQAVLVNQIPENIAMDWLWEFTPFPIGCPTEEQLNQLKHLYPKP